MCFMKVGFVYVYLVLFFLLGIREELVMEVNNDEFNFIILFCGI